MTVLVIINEAPYSGERAYNALRLAAALRQDKDVEVRLFFLGDGAWSASAKTQKPENASFDIPWLLERALAAGAHSLVCRTCMDARGILDSDLVNGAKRGTLDDLRAWTLSADRVISF
ncbi:MAG: DsrE family protein [Bryobacteraceae bacterium]|nr:DsrE family protein [Bryobacteraceae bacterium]